MILPNEVDRLDDRELAQRVFDNDRLVVLFYGESCTHSKRFMPHFEEHLDTFDCDVVAVDLSDRRDPRWETYRVTDTPTLALFGRGVELARTRVPPGVGLHRRDIETIARAARAPATPAP